jgi:hypothetical protein
VREVLWPHNDPDYEWDSETIERIAALFDRQGLRPANPDVMAVAQDRLAARDRVGERRVKSLVVEVKSILFVVTNWFDYEGWQVQWAGSRIGRVFESGRGWCATKATAAQRAFPTGNEALLYLYKIAKEA